MACRPAPSTSGTDTVPEFRLQPADKPASTGTPAPKATELPPGHPPMAGTAPDGLPPGHPPMGGTAPGGLPPDHPPIGGTAPPAGGDMRMTADLPPPAVSNDAEAPFQWTAPATWTRAGAAPMRLATYMVPAGAGAGPAECTIVVLGGGAGGAVANINRWRGQVGLAPASEAEIRGTLRSIKTQGNYPAELCEILGPERPGQPNAILAAIIPIGTSSVFLKLTGPAATATAANADFEAFVSSLRPRE